MTAASGQCRMKLDIHASRKWGGVGVMMESLGTRDASSLSRVKHWFNGTSTQENPLKGYREFVPATILTNAL